jgi:hypothetical protein
MCSSTRSLLRLVLLASACVPAPAAAQGVIVNLYPREVVEGEARTRIAADTLAQGIAGAPLTSGAVTRRQKIAQEVGAERRKWRALNDSAAGVIWASQGTTLLPAASVSPGSDQTALYTELAQAVSGGWRFVLGTALAVKTGEEESGTPGAQQEQTDSDPETGFRRFVAGGGNLSFAAMRPLAMRHGTFSNHVFIALPRVWSNIPALDNTDAIEDFGGELAGEYLYLRYARPFARNGTLAPMPELPFLILQLRGGVVMGTNSFYRTIGRSDQKAFAYTVPTLNLNFSNGVRVGVSYFYGFGAFSEHESLRFQVNLAPPKKEDEPGR